MCKNNVGTKIYRLCEIVGDEWLKLSSFMETSNWHK